MSIETSPRTHRFLSTDILTSGYRIVGKIMTTNSGAMGMINDPSFSTLETNDARMARLHMPTKLIDHFEIIHLMKKGIHVICLSRREDLGPQTIVRGGYVNVVEYPVRITTPIFEIEGTMELPGRFDFTSIMADRAQNFMPIFNATVTAILIPSLRIESAGILVNSKLVDLMALLNQRVKPEN